MAREAFWNKATVAYAAWLWYRRSGAWPTQYEWRFAGDEHPSTPTVIRVFGNWPELIKAAGKLESDVRRKIDAVVIR